MRGYLALACIVSVVGPAASTLHAQTGSPTPPCNFSATEHALLGETRQFGRDLKRLPAEMLRPTNLRWELPIAAATGGLIAEADRRAADRIQSHDLIHTANTWSNIGLGLELASSAIAWGVGCAKPRTHAYDPGFKALSAMGAAGTVDLALKLAFDRQFPFSRNSTGRFWGGGRSFPSGHAATSFAFAAAIAHEYPRNRWIRWGAFALAAGVSLSRYPAKRHFPSDILAGGTIGYVVGSYFARHSPQ